MKLKRYDEFVNENNKLYETIAYHGSPYDFNYFSDNSIGSGEGSSFDNFGYGFYFTDDIDDAKGYVEKLERGVGEGRLYKVKIPDIKYYLNLDEYLDEQSEYVKSCLIKIPQKYKLAIISEMRYGKFNFEEFKNDIDNDIDEYDFSKDSVEYNNYLNEIIDGEFDNCIVPGFFPSLVNLLDGSYEASELLHQCGIKGNIHNQFRIINYIVFSVDDIQIIKKTKPRISRYL